MEFNPAIQVVLRWAHAIAAVAWVGGALFYLVVLRPSVEASGDHSSFRNLEKAIGQEFKEVVDLSVMVLVVTGAVISFERLSRGSISDLYVAVLVTKVALAGGMFLLARRLARNTTAGAAAVSGDNAQAAPSVIRKWLSPSRLVLVLGLLVFLLATVLKVTYENDLRALL
ncbi:MAG: hypothetical protein HY675_14810 [Chloroflexi bacterium]|nr:hypothetical protein [Chloroflexota bacterium]